MQYVCLVRDTNLEDEQSMKINNFSAAVLKSALHQLELQCPETYFAYPNRAAVPVHVHVFCFILFFDNPNVNKST